MAKSKNTNVKQVQPGVKSAPKHRDAVTRKEDVNINAAPKHRDFIFRFLLFSVIVTGVVYYTDARGYFNPDYTNDHTRRKWNAYYEFTKRNPVDVVMVGNSHLYTGVSPEHLSNALGASCFILASPGTTMTDTYYSLKEAIKVRKPRLAVVETFTLNDYDSHELKPGTLSEQFKSFSARKDLAEKVLSTPVLFASDHYAAAWSNTIRNHSFIFTDTAQIRRNIALGKMKQRPEQGLYLGRYIRFTSGIEDSTLLKYDRPDFKAYEYSKHMPSAEALKFLQKAIRLCEENNIQLVLLTLPMYHRHVHDYAQFKKVVQEAAGPGVSWLDLQQPYDTASFTPESFENTVSENQHMTYHGSLVAAYKLANYISTNHPGVVPVRSGEVAWKQLFYGSDGYFENHSPENDGVSKVLMAQTELEGGIQLQELILVPQQGAKRLLMKVQPGARIEAVTVELEMQKGSERALVPVQLRRATPIDPTRHLLLLSDYLDPGIEVTKAGKIAL